MEAGAKTSAAAERLEALRASARFGRIRARAPRYAFLAFVVVMCLAGIRSVLAPPSPTPRPASSVPRLDYAEQSYALAFARSYLAYDGSRPEDREAALAPFAASGIEIGAGFLPPRSGSQEVEWANVAQVQQPLAGGVIVTVAAALSTSAQPVYLSVPIDRARGGAIFLAGYPSFVGPPLSTTRSDPDLGGEPVNEAEVSALVSRSLANYLAGDAENLAADLAGAATVTLPTNRLSLTGMDQLRWVDGTGGGAVLATISATDPRGGEYMLRYEVGVRRVSTDEPEIGPGWRVTYVQTISHES